MNDHIMRRENSVLFRHMKGKHKGIKQDFDCNVTIVFGCNVTLTQVSKAKYRSRERESQNKQKME